MKRKKLIAGICAILMTTSAGATFVANPVKAFAKEANAASISLQDYANEVVSLVNQERARQGLGSLKAVPALNNAAEKRSQELVTLFSHTRPDGSDCATVLNEYGVSWRTSGENIAYGYSSPEDVMTSWMNSSGHRANILNASFDSIGIGVVMENGVLYWTQVFTGGTSADTVTTPDITSSVPDTSPAQDNTQDNITVPSQPITTPCVGDDCHFISCQDGTCIINGELCNTQDLLSALSQNCKDNTCIINGKSCNTQDLLSALSQNCEDNTCIINGESCNTQDLLSALSQNCEDNTCIINGESCNTQDLLSALSQNCEDNTCNSNILQSVLKNCK